METFKILTNWETSSLLENCIDIINQSDFKGFNHEEVDSENCVQCIRQKDSDEPLKLSIAICDPRRIISRICLVSQSRIIELNEGNMNACGPYIKTVTGSMLGKKFLEDFLNSFLTEFFERFFDRFF